jgi:toxin secretion/phage lysis holin
MQDLKNTVCAVLGILLSAIAQLFGGWDAALVTLVIFMAVDYVTGLLTAAVFHRSEKTEDGTLESRAGWKGLIRKGFSLLVVLVACRLDAAIGSDFVRDAAVIGFTVNEALSIVENAGLMGVPVPRVIVSAIHVLREREERNGNPEQSADRDQNDGGGK